VEKQKRKSKCVTAEIVKKYSSKGIQVANIGVNTAFMFTDIPFKRPDIYHLVLSDGTDLEVSKGTYDRVKVSDQYTYLKHQEGDVVLLLMGVVVIIVVIVIGLLLLSH
jgi:hypothetical protein